VVDAFLRDTLGFCPEGDLCYVGSQVCLIPPAMPLARYGVLSAGVKVGEPIAKGRTVRLEPHHMFFKCMPLLSRLDVTLDDARLRRYLHGESVEAEVADGYGVLTVAGCPLGGFKAVGSILKNRYPKGLRTI
jgi:NOL1/NOP2/fmu family ribosome biogenesis protein